MSTDSKGVPAPPDRPWHDPDVRERFPAELHGLLDSFDEYADEQESELDEVRSTRDEAERLVEHQDSEAFNVLRAVREWFDDVILFGKTTRTPREIVRKVERALSAEGKGS